MSNFGETGDRRLLRGDGDSGAPGSGVEEIREAVPVGVQPSGEIEPVGFGDVLDQVQGAPPSVGVDDRLDAPVFRRLLKEEARVEALVAEIDAADLEGLRRHTVAVDVTRDLVG